MSFPLPGSLLRASALAFVLAAGCPTGPQAPPPPTGGLLVDGSPAEATLTVNEQLLGPIRLFREQAMPLRPGTWRVEVSAPGCFPWFGEVEIGDEVTTIRVDLRSIPP